MPVEPVHILLKSHMESALDFERTFDAPNIFTTKKKKIFFKDFNLLLAAEEETLWQTEMPCILCCPFFSQSLPLAKPTGIHFTKKPGSVVSKDTEQKDSAGYSRCLLTSELCWPALNTFPLLRHD